MSYALVIDDTIVTTGGLPVSARRLDSGAWVLGLRDADLATQEACGWYAIVDTARPDDQYLQWMYDAGAKEYFDVLGAHGPGFKAPPEKDPGEEANDPAFYNVGDPYYPDERCRVYSFRHIEDVRQIMVDNGDANKKVVVLEFGWTSDSRPDSPYYWHAGGAGIDEAVKGDYMRRSYEFAKANWQPWIGLMSAIYMPDLDWTPEDEQY